MFQVLWNNGHGHGHARHLMLSFCQMQGTILSSLHIWVYLIPITAIWGTYYDYSHLTEEGIAQKIKTKNLTKIIALVSVGIKVQFQAVWLYSLDFSPYIYDSLRIETLTFSYYYCS